MEIELTDIAAAGSSTRASTLNRRSLSQNVQKLQDTLNVLFNREDRTAFIDTLNDYHRCRDVYDFVHSLKFLLDTTAKQHMIPLLRRVIPQSDGSLFDKYVLELDVAPAELKDLLQGSRTPELPHRKVQVETTSSAPKLGAAIKSPDTLSKSLGSPDTPAPVKNVRIRKGGDGLGFSVRGGAEHGIGIYISFVEPDSVAENEGLAPGDQLMSVNDISFLKITHDEAARVLKSAKKLDMVLKSVGRIPGSYIVHQTYTWVDPDGYPVPPPPEIDRTGRYESRGERKSGLMLLKDSDERKVNVVVDDGESLGLMIRGGNEFGLGIYITGVDAFSVAENAGLKIGDQVLDVNGQSFLDISHSDAVRVLKGSPHMMMTIKDVGKLPYARTTYDQTHWIVGVPQNGNDTLTSSHSYQNGHLPSSDTGRRISAFSRGAGSQLMYTTDGPPSQQWVMIIDQAKKLMTEDERMTLTYYLSEYQDDHVTLQALMLALFELLNTHAKFSLLSDIRTIVSPRDIDQFDAMVLKKEVDKMKLQPDYTTYFPDKTSDYSASTCDSIHSGFQNPGFSHYSERPDSSTAFYSQVRTPHRGGSNSYTVTQPLSRDSKRNNDHSNQSASTSTSRDQKRGRNAVSTQSLGRNAHMFPRKNTTKSGSDSLGRKNDSKSDSTLNNDLGHNTTNSYRSRNGQRREASRATTNNNNNIGSSSSGSRSNARSSRENSLGRSRSSERYDSRFLGLGHEGDDNVGKEAEPGMEGVGLSDTVYGDGYNTHDRGQAKERSEKAEGGLNDAINEIGNRSRNGFTGSDGPPRPVERHIPPHHHGAPSPSVSRKVAADVHSAPRDQADSFPLHSPDSGVDMSRRKIKNSPPPGKKTANKGQRSPAATTSKQYQPESMVKSTAEKERSTPAPTKEGVALLPVHKTQPTLGIAIEGGANTRQPMPRIINIQKIRIRKTKPVIGIAIVGGAETLEPLPRVIEIKPGGSAYESGGLKVGHVILEVDGQPLKGLEHKDVAQVIARAFKNRDKDYMELLVADSNSKLAVVK